MTLKRCVIWIRWKLKLSMFKSYWRHNNLQFQTKVIISAIYFYSPRFPLIDSLIYLYSCHLVTFFYKQLHFRPAEPQIFENRSNFVSNSRASNRKFLVIFCLKSEILLNFARFPLYLNLKWSKFKQPWASIPKILSSFLPILRFIKDMLISTRGSTRKWSCL